MSAKVGIDFCVCSKIYPWHITSHTPLTSIGLIVASWRALIGDRIFFAAVFTVEFCSNNLHPLFKSSLFFARVWGRPSNDSDVSPLMLIECQLAQRHINWRWVSYTQRSLSHFSPKRPFIVMPTVWRWMRLKDRSSFVLDAHSFHPQVVIRWSWVEFDTVHLAYVKLGYKGGKGDVRIWF